MSIAHFFLFQRFSFFWNIFSRNQPLWDWRNTRASVRCIRNVNKQKLVKGSCVKSCKIRKTQIVLKEVFSCLNKDSEQWIAKCCSHKKEVNFNKQLARLDQSSLFTISKGSAISAKKVTKAERSNFQTFPLNFLESTYIIKKVNLLFLDKSHE